MTCRLDGFFSLFLGVEFLSRKTPLRHPLGGMDENLTLWWPMRGKSGKDYQRSTNAPTAQMIKNRISDEKAGGCKAECHRGQQRHAGQRAIFRQAPETYGRSCCARHSPLPRQFRPVRSGCGQPFENPPPYVSERCPAACSSALSEKGSQGQWRVCRGVG